MNGTLRDRLWLWCHPAGSLMLSHDQQGLVGKSTITPAEAVAKPSATVGAPLLDFR
jgi:hypothetical protein